MLQQLDTLIGFAVVMTVVSLLITIITQMISSLLGLRGNNLADGLVAMLYKIVPDLDEKVRKDLVDHILTRPITSDSMISMKDKFWDKIPMIAWLRKRWKRASAIRPEELMEVLKKLAEVEADQAKPALAQLQTVNNPDPMKKAALTVLSALHVTTPVIDQRVSALHAQLPGMVQADPVNATAIIDQVNDATNVALGNLEKSFNSAQDRAKQWFAMNARLWTIIAAIVMAFILQLDTFRLISKLSSDPNERNKLIQFSQTTLQKKADEIFTNSLASSTIYKQAIDKLKTSGSNIPSLPTNTLFETQAAAESWIKDQAATNAPALLLAFGKEVQSALKKNYDQAGLEFGNLTDAFSQTGVQLMQNPYPPVFTDDWKLWSWPWNWRLAGNWSWPASHLFGILFSAALLSLGAPFWFNSLKTLANLRPMLATQIDQDEKAKTAKTAGF